MTDYTELKRAADAASQGHWNQDGFEVQNDDIEDYRVSRCNLLADAKFIAAANPAVVLALIAENEALRKDAERYRWLKSRPVNAPTSGPDLAQWDDHQGDALRGLFADEAIDAAMGKGEQS